MKTRVLASLTAALLAGALLPAAAQDKLPKRKAGLWEVTMQSPAQGQGQAMPPMKTQQCIDDKTDEEMQRKAMSDPNARMQCKQTAMRRLSNGVEVEMDCSGQDGKMHSVSRMTGDMNSNYTVDMRTTFSPPRHGVSEMKMTMTARHAGACPAGMNPGDMRMGGMTFNPGGGVSGMDPAKMKNMSPEELKKFAEEMRKATQGAK